MEATVQIERYADQGRCVAHIDGRVVFVRFALPGERVRIVLDEPTDRSDRFWTGEVVEVLEASPDRVAPSWPLAGPLAMGGGVGGADLIHVSLEGQERWKEAAVMDVMRRLGHVELDEIPVYAMPGDEDAQGLHWRTRIEMITDDEGRPSMHREAPQVLPQYVIDQIREVLGDRAPRNGRNLVIWDLYSGSGLFTLPLATLIDEHAKLVSVEGAKTAVANARRNLKSAGIHTVQALCGDVLKTLEKDIDPQRAHPDIVVLDPPRAGAKAKVCTKIANSGAPIVVYIACDPASLARDTATLTQHGYALHSIAAFDIYPMTHHVETVAVFTK